MFSLFGSTNVGGVLGDVVVTQGKRKNDEGNMTRLRKKLARRTKLNQNDTGAGCIDLSSAEKLTPLKRHVADSGIFARSPFEEEAEMPGLIKETSIKKYRQIARCTDEELDK
jgi:hypothetical protein